MKKLEQKCVPPQLPEETKSWFIIHRGRGGRTVGESLDLDPSAVKGRENLLY